MGKFRTDDDYSPMDNNSYHKNDSTEYSWHNNPEIGNSPGGYGPVKKPSLISRMFSTLGTLGTGAGSGIKNGINAEKVMFGLYFIAMVIIVINLTTVLDLLFYATASILQYVMLVLVVVLLGYILLRYVLHIR